MNWLSPYRRRDKGFGAWLEAGPLRGWGLRSLEHFFIAIVITTKGSAFERARYF
jgi:hypothetical protein